MILGGALREVRPRQAHVAPAKCAHMRWWCYAPLRLNRRFPEFLEFLEKTI